MAEIKVNCSFSEMVAIKKIKRHPRNPNKHPPKQIEMLCQLLRVHGWRYPITVSKLSGLVIRGHGRLEAAKKLNLKEVPVDFQEYENETAELADLIADNKISEFSEFDLEGLHGIIVDLEEASIDSLDFGFDEASVDDLSQAIIIEYGGDSRIDSAFADDGQTNIDDGKKIKKKFIKCPHCKMEFEKK